MTKSILQKWGVKSATGEIATAFAPTNIALVKYWGKRDLSLNLPKTGSLSVTLPSLGTRTQVERNTQSERDTVIVNGQTLSEETDFYKRLHTFLNRIRPPKKYPYKITTDVNIPIAAGLASSASGFAALVLALNKHHDWQLEKWQLSVLARLGSGSACRSFWPGFVQWHPGDQEDGMDSFATPLSQTWPDLCVGILFVDKSPKPISSRDAMEITTHTSPLYDSWPERVSQDLQKVKKALKNRDMALLGKTAESNALAMHETMIQSQPSIDFSTPETLAYREKVRTLRRQGIPIYFTQDAGPNLKLLFEKSSLESVEIAFPDVGIISVFEKI
ncbi:MAG: diphosphomevalonate decarboxylase [bacterium]|nr:diphosphomevalonate decarboxylase [bacterium]